MTVAYLESSALVKLVVLEPESDALHDVIATHEQLVTSELAVVELGRAARRARGKRGVDRAGEILGALHLAPIDRAVLARARGLAPLTLRSLDAIHVATAIELDIDDLVFVAYDARCLDAAESVGLAVTSPRRPERLCKKG